MCDGNQSQDRPPPFGRRHLGNDLDADGLGERVAKDIADALQHRVFKSSGREGPAEGVHAKVRAERGDDAIAGENRWAGRGEFLADGRAREIHYGGAD